MDSKKLESFLNFKIKNTEIDMAKLEQYRTDLYVQINNYPLPELTTEEQKIYDKLFNHIFELGEFASINIICNNPDFQKKVVS